MDVITVAVVTIAVLVFIAGIAFAVAAIDNQTSSNPWTRADEE